MGVALSEERSWEEDLRILVVRTEQLERLTVPVWMGDLPERTCSGVVGRIGHETGIDP